MHFDASLILLDMSLVGGQTSVLEPCRLFDSTGLHALSVRSVMSSVAEVLGRRQTVTARKNEEREELFKL